MVAAAICAAAASGSGAACGGSQRPVEPVVAPLTLEWIQRAESYERERRYDQARSAYRRAKRVAPDAASRAHASRAFGLALDFWGEYVEARNELQLAAELRPDHAAAWHDLGMVCVKLRDYGAAERALRRAIRLRPRDPRPRIALAEMYWQLQHRYADARTEYQSLLSLQLSARLGKAVRWALCELKRQLAHPDTEAGPLPFDEAACPLPRRRQRPTGR